MLNMLIGVPKEIKNNEFRVGLIAGGVRILTNADHEVFLQKCAGKESGITDEEYKAGAILVETREDVLVLCPI